MYSDVDAFERRNDALSPEKVSPLPLPCQEAVGKPPRKEPVKKGSSQAPGLNRRRRGVRQQLLRARRGAQPPPHHPSPLQSEAHFTRDLYFLRTLVEALPQDFINTDPAVLPRPGEGKYPAVGSVPTAPLQ